MTVAMELPQVGQGWWKRHEPKKIQKLSSKKSRSAVNCLKSQGGYDGMFQSERVYRGVLHFRSISLNPLQTCFILGRFCWI